MLETAERRWSGGLFGCGGTGEMNCFCSDGPCICAIGPRPCPGCEDCDGTEEDWSE